MNIGDYVADTAILIGIGILLVSQIVAHVKLTRYFDKRHKELMDRKRAE